jgi:hypothetical protein
MYCAGQLCTGGMDRRLKVWDLRRMRNGASLNPDINASSLDRLFSLASANPLGESHMIMAGKAADPQQITNLKTTQFTIHGPR